MVLGKHSKEIKIDAKKCLHQMGTIENVFRRANDKVFSRPTSTFLKLIFGTFKSSRFKNIVSKNSIKSIIQAKSEKLLFISKNSILSYKISMSIYSYKKCCVAKDYLVQLAGIPDQHDDLPFGLVHRHLDFLPSVFSRSIPLGDVLCRSARRNVGCYFSLLS